MYEDNRRHAVLNNGVRMPLLGLGVLHIKDGQDVVNAVQWALETGYRLIDTASVYKNEEGVGRALRESGVPREEVFLTTKVWNSDQGYGQAISAFESSLDKLGVDFIDLYLIHWPGPNPDVIRETWRALETIYASGRVSAIGLSNFQIPHIERLLDDVQILPAVNQVELHPRLQQSELVSFCNEHRIQIEAWRPIMKGQVHEIPELKDLAAKYHKNPVQITLRWLIQQGLVVIPKSEHRGRIRENIEVFDFELTTADVKLIEELDMGTRLGPDPFSFFLDFNLEQG